MQAHDSLNLSQPISFLVGGYAARVTPVPIPNTVVKPRWADGTAGEIRWESTTSPAFTFQSPVTASRGDGAFTFLVLCLGASVAPGAFFTGSAVSR